MGAGVVPPSPGGREPMTETISLPILVGGRRVESAARYTDVLYDEKYCVRIPSVDLEDARKMLGGKAKRALASVPVDDITIFFDEVGRRWRHPDNKWRRTVLEWVPRITGYARSTVEWDVNLLGGTLNRSKLYDLLEHDLGDPGLLDEFTRTRAVYHRCLPKGTMVNIMVGNVPMAALFSVYRSLVTKNLTVAKLPKRDLVTALCFAQCIFDTDPQHPVAKALSVAYWEPESDVEDFLLQSADVVSVWGRAKTIASIRRRASPTADIIEFGPKRSFAVVLRECADWERAGMRIAYDIASYNQEGCFSVQEVFVQGEPAPLVNALRKWLDNYAASIPQSAQTVDDQAHVQRARIEARAYGWDVHAPDSTDWTIVVTDGPAPVFEHPLGRTVYVHPFSDLEQVSANIDHNVQTVSIEPFDLVWRVADEFGKAGVNRFVEIGRHTRVRPGFSQDGFHPMRRMVRWVTIERGLDYKYRFMKSSPEEDEKRIYQQLQTIAE